MRGRLLRQMISLALLAVFPASVAAFIHPKRPEWHRPAGDEVELSTARQWQEKVLWVDARPREQFDADHIPGALLLNSYEWEELLDPFLDHWKAGLTVIVYCGGENCDLSKEVAKRLREEVQIPDVHVLKGGWQAWRASQK